MEGDEIFKRPVVGTAFREAESQMAEQGEIGEIDSTTGTAGQPYTYTYTYTSTGTDLFANPTNPPSSLQNHHQHHQPNIKANATYIGFGLTLGFRDALTRAGALNIVDQGNGIFSFEVKAVNAGRVSAICENFNKVPTLDEMKRA